MPKLRFEGYSDDTFGEVSHFKQDHDNCANGKPIVFEVKAGEDGLLVWGQYGGHDWPMATPSCWVIGVQLLEEDAALPAWPMAMAPGDRGYTHALVIDAPDGVTLRCLNSDVGED